MNHHRQGRQFFKHNATPVEFHRLYIIFTLQESEVECHVEAASRLAADMQSVTVCNIKKKMVQT